MLTALTHLLITAIEKEIIKQAPEVIGGAIEEIKKISDKLLDFLSDKLHLLPNDVQDHGDEYGN